MQLLSSDIFDTYDAGFFLMRDALWIRDIGVAAIAAIVTFVALTIFLAEAVSPSIIAGIIGGVIVGFTVFAVMHLRKNI